MRNTTVLDNWRHIPLLAASGVTLLDVAKNLKDGLVTPDEIKKDKFYFLWKLAKKDMKRHIVK